MKIRYNKELKTYLEVVEYSQLELKQLKLILNKKTQNAHFDPRYKKGYWDGKISFIEYGKFISRDLWNLTIEELVKQGLKTSVVKFEPLVKANSNWGKIFYNVKTSIFIPTGLYEHVKTNMEKYGFGVEFEGLEHIIDETIKYEDVEEFVKSLNVHINDELIEFKEHQINSVYNALRFKYSQQELATSSGKTLISFAIFAFLKVKKNVKQSLMIVPKLGLLSQGFNDFHEYAEKCEIYKPRICLVGDGQKIIDKKADIVIGTYQTLVKLNTEEYKNFDNIIIDEAHSGKSKSVKGVLVKCINSDYRIGISGTLNFKDWSAEWATITGYIGPLVNKVRAKEIIEIGFATPVKIHMLVLDYTSHKMKYKLNEHRRVNKGNEVFSLRSEQEYIITNQKRTTYITNMISKVTSNTLVLFKDIKNGYGKLLRDIVREKTSDKEIFYIDGSTKSKHRDYIKIKMEEGENKILFASFPTFATGISVKNILNIFLVESYKSETIIKQALGRGMRKHKSKKHLNVIDFVDDMSILKNPIAFIKEITEDNWSTSSKNANYMLRHGKARYAIYKGEEHEINIIPIKIG